ncbi:MAG: NAD(P)/FAD-dependent oxidoreductase [Actinomycetota bacterium]
MRVVIVGGGMAGLLCAKALRRRGVEPAVLERMPAGTEVPGVIMLPWQAYDACRDVGAYDEIRSRGWDVAPTEQGPTAIAVTRQAILDALGRDVDVRHDQEILDLVRDGDRVAGVRVRGPEGERVEPADLVVGADGAASRVRQLAGIDCELRPSEAAGLSFRSPVVPQQPFAMTYQSDGRQVGLLGWPGGSAGWWQIDRMGRDAALAPGLDEFKRCYARLLPAGKASVDALTSIDQVTYREVTEVVCDAWWRPGVVLIGEAAHSIDPESGVGAGLALGDAHALAVAIARSDGPDAACASYETWRRPFVEPYLAIGAQGSRIVFGTPGADRPPVERWPPVT